VRSLRDVFHSFAIRLASRPFDFAQGWL